MTMKLIRTQEGTETWDADCNPSEFEIKYFVTYPTGKASAMKAVFNDAPATYGDLVLSGVRFESYDEDGNMEISALYEADSSSSDSDDETETEPTFSFDCSGGSKHLTHAINQKRVYPSGEDDDTGGAIGWNGKPDDPVTGVDIPTGQLRETYTKTMRMSAITTARKRAWNSLVGKVNSVAFKGWLPGEVMFLGCSFSGSSDSSSKVTVQFNFSIQENESNATVSGISCGSKEGFQCIWANSEPKKSDDNTPELKIKGVYIATVCENCNFGILGI